MQLSRAGHSDNQPAHWKPCRRFLCSKLFASVDQQERGTFSALNVRTNRLFWQKKWKDACYSGSLTTAGGLVFIGRNDGTFTALDTRTGKQLWSFQTGTGVNAPPSAFEYKNRQYLVVLAGGNLFAGTQRGDSLWLFALDGKLGPAPAPSVARKAVEQNHGKYTISTPDKKIGRGSCRERECQFGLRQVGAVT